MPGPVRLRADGVARGRRHGSGGWGRWGEWGEWGEWASVAALVALAVGLGVVGQRARHGTAAAPRQAALVAPAHHENMLIALYRAEDGKDAVCPDCWCIQSWHPEWEAEVDVRRVADADVLAESIVRSCVTDPSRIVVVGLSGPREALPASDDQAREVALCLLEGSPDAAGSFGAPGCVASSIEYRIHTWNR